MKNKVIQLKQEIIENNVTNELISTLNEETMFGSRLLEKMTALIEQGANVANSQVLRAYIKKETSDQKAFDLLVKNGANVFSIKPSDAHKVHQQRIELTQKKLADLKSTIIKQGHRKDVQRENMDEFIEHRNAVLDHNGSTLTMWAFRTGKKEIFNMIVKQDHSVVKTTNKLGNTILNSAASWANDFWQSDDPAPFRDMLAAVKKQGFSFDISSTPEPTLENIRKDEDFNGIRSFFGLKPEY